MSREQFREMLDVMAAAWSNRDYRRVAEHFQDELFYSDPLSYSIFTREDLLAFFVDDDGKPQRCTFHNAVFDEERQLGTAEYTYEGTYRYHGTVWVEINGDKITSWREYQHKSEESWEAFWKIDERDRS